LNNFAVTSDKSSAILLTLFHCTKAVGLDEVAMRASAKLGHSAPRERCSAAE
jgi:hypothetical protein